MFGHSPWENVWHWPHRSRRQWCFGADITLHWCSSVWTQGLPLLMHSALPPATQRPGRLRDPYTSKYLYLVGQTVSCLVSIQCLVFVLPCNMQTLFQSISVCCCCNSSQRIYCRTIFHFIYEDMYNWLLTPVHFSFNCQTNNLMLSDRRVSFGVLHKTSNGLLSSVMVLQ